MPAAAAEEASATASSTVAPATMDLPPASAASSPLSSPRSVSTPSSPLSQLSSTPSRPSSPTAMAYEYASHRYPSPMSTTVSGTQSPIKLGEPMFANASRAPRSRLDDGAPPAKRRKFTQPKERTTEFLDLAKPHEEFTADDAYQMDRLLDALHKKKKIVVIAGAGISVSAGIPDFRSSTGLFATARNQHKLKASGKHLFDASVYKHDSSTQSFHTMVRQMAQMTKEAQPTPFHHLLASLAQEGRLLRLYSQNIDCIDTSMTPLSTNVPLNQKGPWPTTVQLHGGLQKMVCTKCSELKPFQPELFDGPEAPLCQSCEEDDQVRTNHAGKRSHGIGRLRPRFVLYNEFNPDEEAIGNVSSADLKARPDAVIVVGTTLKVPGTRRLVKELCQVARGRRNGFTAWINIAPEPKGVDFKDCWDLVVKSSCDNVARLAALPPWDCHIGDDYLVSREQDLQNQENRGKTTVQVQIRSSSASPSPQFEPEVHLTARPKLVEDVQGIPTPRPSPKLSAVRQTGKPKQTKLAFGKTVDDGKPKKTVTLKARKSKQPVKTEPSKGGLLNAFKATKKIAGREKIKQVDSDGPDLGLPAVKEESDARVSLPALRPERPRQGSRDSIYYTPETSAEAESDTNSAPPSTPPISKRRLSQDTISPTCVSNDMAGLIDVA